jgi:hypothetical protein
VFPGQRGGVEGGEEAVAVTAGERVGASAVPLTVLEGLALVVAEESWVVLAVLVAALVCLVRASFPQRHR